MYVYLGMGPMPAIVDVWGDHSTPIIQKGSTVDPGYYHTLSAGSVYAITRDITMRDCRRTVMFYVV